MITNIRIVNYKSFHPTEATDIGIETDKAQPVILYGINGAGKSAIGEVIYGCANGDQQFDGCRVDTTGHGPFRYLVYNHEFVSKVIGEAKGMPGIFTIGEPDTETQKEIEEQERVAEKSEKEREAHQDEIKRIQSTQNRSLAAARDDVWKAYQAHANSDLGKFLAGYGRDKKKFFEDLRKYESPDDEPLDDIDTLIKRLKDVTGDAKEKSTHSIDFRVQVDIEDDPIWKESIDVSGESRLAPLVEKLGNGDWVSKGRPYIQDDQCPFCQQGLPHDFLEELSNLLDGGDRQEKLNAVDVHITDYAEKIRFLTEKVAAALAEPLSEETRLNEEWESFLAKMRSNLAAMKLKRERPSDPVSVLNTDYKGVEDALQALNQRVKEFNDHIADKKGERTAIKEMFWKVMCRDRLSAYRAFDAIMRPLSRQLDEAVAKDKAAQKRQSECEARLAELRSMQTGVDAAVVKINQRLQDLGIRAFWLARKSGEGSLYCLERPDQKDCDAYSLSEGEKTLISFLYFMELLRGSSEEARTVSIGKTIVVVDDPISSLSQNYVYDIASIICYELLKAPPGERVRQVIVLTHNLFFLHELVHQFSGSNFKNAEKKCQLLRVVKSHYTKIMPMNVRDFANDYDALWQVIRDAKEHKLPTQVVPNTMRCILEHFFAFTGQSEQFETVLTDISNGDKRFKPLERYLNRGGHRDNVNHAQIDWGQFDLNYYLAKLEAVFNAVGHEEHFKMKMGITAE